MKKKTKISKLLTDQQLEKIQYLSKIFGKSHYFQIIEKVSSFLRIKFLTYLIHVDYSYRY